MLKPSPSTKVTRTVRASGSSAPSGADVKSVKTPDDCEDDAKAICEKIGFVGEDTDVANGVQVKDARRIFRKWRHEIHQAALNPGMFSELDKDDESRGGDKRPPSPTAERLCRHLGLDSGKDGDVVAAISDWVSEHTAAENS